MAGPRDRHPRNCEGAFYVANGECISCGAPESEAEGLMAHDEDGHCFFVRQPATAEETNSAVRSVWVGCCGAVRYGGNDPQILTRLAHLGATYQCDQRAPIDGSQVVRNCAHFEYRNPESAPTHREPLKDVVDFVANAVRLGYGTETFEFHASSNEASFEYSWSSEWVNNSCSVRITHDSANRWLLRISDHQASPRPRYPSEHAHPLMAIAIRVDKALQRDAAFQSIHWFGEDSGPNDRQDDPHPY